MLRNNEYLVGWHLSPLAQLDMVRSGRLVADEVNTGKQEIQGDRARKVLVMQVQEE